MAFPLIFIQPGLSLTLKNLWREMQRCSPPLVTWKPRLEKRAESEDVEIQAWKEKTEFFTLLFMLSEYVNIFWMDI